MRVSPIALQKALRGIGYPATTADLLDRARQNGAGDDVLAVLQDLPDREYSGPNQVTSAVAELD